jgi:hypothetical protein
MATAAQTIESVMPDLEGVGYKPSTLAQLVWRMQGGDLIPKAGKGGGIVGIDLQVPPLTNFAIGIAAVEIIKEAAAVVPVYRALIPIQKTITTTECDGLGKIVIRLETKRRILPEPRTLLSTVDRPLTEALAEVWNDPPDIDLGLLLENTLRHYDPSVEAQIKEFLVWRSRPWAELTVRNAPGVTETWTFGPAPDRLEPSATSSAWTQPSGICFSMPVGIFKTLARLAHDSVRQDQQHSSDAAAEAAVEDAETMTPAAVGARPASVDNSPMVNQPGSRPVILQGHAQQDSDANKRGQSPHTSASRGSPSSDHSDQRRDVPPWPSSNSPRRSAG